MTGDELALEFETWRGELRSFLLRLTASVPDADDLVQDTYLRAAAKINLFRGEASLKTWVFAIAVNLARDLRRAQQRWPETVTDLARQAALSQPAFLQEALRLRHTSPQGNFEIREHIAFCFTCLAKTLPLDQHLAVLLKEVYGFTVKETALILRLSEAMVKYHLHQARARLADIFERRCALINKQGICHQCTELNGLFNPKQAAQEELVKLELVRQASNPDRQALLDHRLQILRELDPFTSGAAELQLHHLEHNRQLMDKHLAEPGAAPIVSERSGV